MYKRLLLATDLSVDNHALIVKAQTLAKQWNSELFIAHIVEPMPSYGYEYVGSADVEAKLIEEATQQLQNLGREYHIPESHQYIDIGPTKTEIIRLAQEEKVDLIIVGSHGRHGLAHLLGATAEAILHRAGCDVLTIRIGV